MNYNALEWLDEDVDFMNDTDDHSSGFEALFQEQEESGNAIKEGQVVQGTVIELRKDDVVLDIGHKSAGAVPKVEFINTTTHEPIEVNVGDVFDVYIEVFEDDAGELVLSKEKADMRKAWDRVSAAFESNELVEGKILGRIKGGLSVDIGIKAFLPGSQVDLRPIRNLEKLLGQVLQFKIIKFNKKRGNVVLSRRVLLEQDRARLRDETLKTLKVGAAVTGVVKNITDYGAFVDLGGFDGLLHVTDMSWGRQNNPNELLRVGDEIQVKVLSFDPATNRVSLGVKQLHEDPWLTAIQKYSENQKLRGKVVSLTDYGAFIELEPGVEGLIHITEMTWNRRIKHPSKLVNIGDEVDVIVLAVDLENHRISLGMKQIEPNPWEIVTQKYRIGDVIRGKIRNITDFGIFVGIEDGVDGLIHISDISYTQRIAHPQEVYKKGDEIEAKVLQIDAENMRFSLGIKQLESDPYDAALQHFTPGLKAKGLVTKVVDFGVFIEMEPGVEGLIHTSELDSTEYAEGQEVEFIVLRSSIEERRFDLSQKAALRGLSESHNKIIQNALHGGNEKKNSNSLAEAFARAKEK